MLDLQLMYINCKEPLLLMARWSGNGSGSAPLPVAKTTRPTGPGAPQGGPITIVRNGTGNLTVTLPNPVGIFQSYDFWVASPANNKVVQITPPTAGGNTFALIVTYAANGTAVDVATTEELQMMTISSISANP